MNPELAQAIEDIETRAIVRGQQLMHAPADKLLELCKLAKASAAPAGKSDSALVAALEAKIVTLEAKLAAVPAPVDVAPFEAKIAELEAWQKDVAAHNDRLTTDSARFEALALEATQKNAELEAKLAAVPPAVDVAAIEGPLKAQLDEALGKLTAAEKAAADITEANAKLEKKIAALLAA